MTDYEWIDDCFRIEQKRFGTFVSYNREEKQLVTSLTQEQCVNATRYYLKLQQENLLNNVGVAYTSTVDGKL
jgi:hypothetical protein